MPTLEEVVATLGSPAAIIGMQIGGVASGLIVLLICLIFSKSRNTVFTFIKKRSAKQIEKRRRRVEMMRRGEKHFHLYLSLVNSRFLIGIMLTVWASTCFIAGLVVPISGGLWVIWFWFAMGILFTITALYYLLEGIAIQEDLEDAVEDD